MIALKIRHNCYGICLVAYDSCNIPINYSICSQYYIFTTPKSSFFLHPQVLDKIWSNGLGKALGWLSGIVSELYKIPDELKVDTEPPDQVGIPVIKLFRMGKIFYKELKDDLLDYIDKRKTREQREEDVVTSMRDLRRYLKVMSVFLGKQNEEGFKGYGEDHINKRVDDNNEAKLMRGGVSKMRRRKASEEAEDYWFQRFQRSQK